MNVKTFCLFSNTEQVALMANNTNTTFELFFKTKNELNIR